MKIQEIYFRSSGKKLYGIWEMPENTNKPAVILLHGLTNNHLDCPLIDDAAKILQKIGFPTFRFDYFGSGKSEGVFKDKIFSIMVQNTRDALKIVKQKYKMFGVWGRSLGAIIASTICSDPNIFATALLSSTMHTNISFSRFFSKNNPYSLPIIGTAKVKGENVLPYKFYQETKWLDDLQKKVLSKSKNVLVTQGTEDKTIYDLNWAKQIYVTVQKPKKLIYVKGANHAYKGYEKETMKIVVNWLTKKMREQYS